LGRAIRGRRTYRDGVAIAGEGGSTTADDVQDGVVARALMLEIHDLVTEAVDARLWAIRGVRMVLEQDLATTAEEDRRARVQASAERAIAHWNSMTLVVIYGALEDLVEGMGTGLYPIVRATNPTKRKEIFERNRLRNRELMAAGELTGEGAHALTKFTKVLTDALLPDPLREPNRQLPPADRWEDLLSRIYMRPIPERALPDDLRLTINEFAAVRNVILHRMGRMDEKALKNVSEGPWRTVNERVVIDAELYRRYIAALIAYQRELEDRIRSRVGVTPQSNIAAWRTMVPAGG
jgi:hypothetical protein